MMSASTYPSCDREQNRVREFFPVDEILRLEKPLQVVGSHWENVDLPLKTASDGCDPVNMIDPLGLDGFAPTPQQVQQLQQAFGPGGPGSAPNQALVNQLSPQLMNYYQNVAQNQMASNLQAIRSNCPNMQANMNSLYTQWTRLNALNNARAMGVAGAGAVGSGLAGAAAIGGAGVGAAFAAAPVAVGAAIAGVAVGGFAFGNAVGTAIFGSW